MQHIGIVVWTSCPQAVMMSALDDSNRVDLYVAQAFNGLRDPFMTSGQSIAAIQQLRMDRNSPGQGS